ncbi:MAG: DUF2726 domain-containing protein [Rubrivivax sp.]
MEMSALMVTFALPATVLLLLMLLALRMRQRPPRRGPRAPHEAQDTVADWPPQAARVMTIDERQAYDLLRRAMPQLLVLAQVPLSRFVRVPSRRSHLEWLQRVGSISADLLLCDSGSRVIAVVDIRSRDESPRSRSRHERMARVLKTCGIEVLTWSPGALPNLQQVRLQLQRLTAADVDDTAGASDASMPDLALPLPEIAELLAAGDGRHDMDMEPVPSAFFDDLDAVPAQAA